MPLGEVAEAILLAGNTNPEVDRAIYTETDDLDQLMSFGAVREYPLESVASRFETLVLKLFENRDRPELPLEVAAAIRVEAENYRRTGGRLGWSFFGETSQIWPMLHDRFADPTLKARYSKTVFNLARGPYVTALPSVLECDPIYSSEDRFGIDALRGRSSLSKEELAKKTLRRLQLSPADYVAGLARLSVDEIGRLLESDEKKHLDSCVAQLASPSDGEPRTADLNEALIALNSYRRRIDDQIVSATLQSRRPNLFETYEVNVSYPIRPEVDRWLWFSAKLILNAKTFHIPEVLHFTYERICSRLGTGEEARVKASAAQFAQLQEADRARVLLDLQRSGSNLLDTNIVVESRHTDICSDVSCQ